MVHINDMISYVMYYDDSFVYGNIWYGRDLQNCRDGSSKIHRLENLFPQISMDCQSVTEVRRKTKKPKKPSLEDAITSFRAIQNELEVQI